MSKKDKTEKKSMSGTVKWLLTALLAVLAVVTVVICVKGGNFTFKPGFVQANDDVVVEETKAPENDKDEPDETVKHKVFISAGNGGSASPNGSVEVEDWGSLTINFTPNKGYEIVSVTVDGADQGAVESYTLSYVKGDHTVIATFEKKPEPTPTPTPEQSDGSIFPGLDKLFGDD